MNIGKNKNITLEFLVETFVSLVINLKERCLMAKSFEEMITIIGSQSK